MHPLLLEEIVALCKRRQSQGDCPLEPPASVETLEDAIVQLGAAVGVVAADYKHPQYRMGYDAGLRDEHRLASVDAAYKRRQGWAEAQVNWAREQAAKDPDTAEWVKLMQLEGKA